MGYGEDFWQGDLEACLNYQLEPAELTAQALRESPRGVFVARTKPIEYEKYSDYFGKLPEGKFQCYLQTFEGKSNCRDTGELHTLPVYKGPPESIDGTPDIAQEYPLIFSDVHAYRLCVHSYMNNIPWLRERQPYPWVRINPATAKQYGISDGDWVKVESPHGWCKFRAVYFEGLRPDTLMAKRGWWQACEELGLPGYSVFDGGSEAQVLYNDDETLFDEFSSSMSKATLVKISRA
jgi:thiosulfate reductase/polysulfide reductase chain A